MNHGMVHPVNHRIVQPVHHYTHLTSPKET